MATVLVVDDEEDIRYLVKINLELDGHRVVLASDGREALDAVRSEPPDLVLLDLMMPDVDGWQVLESLKSETDLDIQQIPVLMLTAHDTPENRIRGGIEGAIRYLTKPFSPEALRDEIRDALGGAPEPVQRKRAQTEALELLARHEKGKESDDAIGRPHLDRLERAPVPHFEPPVIRLARDRLGQLTDKQLELLRALRTAPSVTDAAVGLGVSRSNIYASLRRISRKLGTASVPELLAILRTGGLLDGADG